MNNLISEIKLSYNPVKLSSGVKNITSSDDAYDFILDHWNKDTIELQEEFKVILLNNSNEVIGIYEMSKGGIASTLVDLRLLFAVVLKACAVSIITVHNHPSGNLKPSEIDVSMYSKINEAAKLLDIKHLDCLIITKKGKFSFSDQGIY